MKLIDVLREECIVANARFADKAEVLCAVAGAAKKSDVLSELSEQEILAALEERELLGSTGFGDGIAIPHCRLKSVPDFVVGIVTVPTGVDFDALDDEPVRLIVFIVAPESQSNRHMKLLSAISQTLLIPGAVKELVAESTSQGVFESFVRHTRADIDTSVQAAKSICNIFVEDEKVFRGILEKLEGLEASSLVVLNAERSAAYLSKMPLFADFWRDRPSDFGMMIVLVVQKGLVNETIRRIETVTGNLNECVGVMVTVQDVSYSGGSL